jgi:hypothetical protein
MHGSVLPIRSGIPGGRSHSRLDIFDRFFIKLCGPEHGSDLLASVFFALGTLAMMGRNMRTVNPPGDSCMSLAVNPFAKEITRPSSLLSPDHLLVWVNMIPDALLCESLSKMRFFTDHFIIGLMSLQSFAKSKSKRFAALGASPDSIDFFLSSLASLLRWEAAIAARFFIIAKLREFLVFLVLRIAASLQPGV